MLIFNKMETYKTIPIENVNVIIGKPNKTYKFDVNENSLYEHDKPKERTQQRLIEIAECSMELVGYGEFGYKGIMSGLYIEKVWSYSDESFKDYMTWAKQLIKEKTSNKQ